MGGVSVLSGRSALSGIGDVWREMSVEVWQERLFSDCGLSASPLEGSHSVSLLFQECRGKLRCL